jgi:hypothetical protein
VLGEEGQEVRDGAGGVADGEDGRHGATISDGFGRESPVWRQVNCCFG